LPAGAKAVWDLDKAFRETTYSRERICINGLWQWQPSSAEHARRGDATELRPRFAPLEEAVKDNQR